MNKIISNRISREKKGFSNGITHKLLPLYPPTYHIFTRSRLDIPDKKLNYVLLLSRQTYPSNPHLICLTNDFRIIFFTYVINTNK